ncbi:hypothetical protein CYMTET_55931 [Cymbomonas tetramitiformis]|uniref:RWP-RK domain-containing protein n=1 Tax=Cymbomonas tetramitiformis TaxID=36881 RepID=A0AAE0BDA1_9CHLO|nr:hypothetical protein CYMTET_55931 [Cymbomonas tetramitiformis]
MEFRQTFEICEPLKPCGYKYKCPGCHTVDTRLHAVTQRSAAQTVSRLRCGHIEDAYVARNDKSKRAVSTTRRTCLSSFIPTTSPPQACSGVLDRANTTSDARSMSNISVPSVSTAGAAMTLDDSTAMEETASMFAWENSKLDDSMWPDGYLGYLQGTTGNEGQGEGKPVSAQPLSQAMALTGTESKSAVPRQPSAVLQGGSALQPSSIAPSAPKPSPQPAPTLRSVPQRSNSLPSLPAALEHSPMRPPISSDSPEAGALHSFTSNSDHSAPGSLQNSASTSSPRSLSAIASKGGSSRDGAHAVSKTSVGGERWVSYDVLQKHFRFTLRTAARMLGVCPTTLKRICRQYNIARWPCRTLKRQEQEQAAKANGARRSVTAGSNLARLTPRLQPEIAPRWQGNKDPLADASPSYSWDSTLAAGTAGLTVGNRVSGYPSAGAAVRDQGATTSQPTVSGSSVVTADSEEIKSKTQSGYQAIPPVTSRPSTDSAGPHHLFSSSLPVLMEKAMQTFYADMPPLWDPPESSQEPNAIAAGLVSVPHTTGPDTAMSTDQWPARRLGTHSSTVSPSTSASDLKSLNNPAARGLLSQQLGSQGFERSEQVAEAAGDGTEVFVVKAQMGKQILRFRLPHCAYMPEKTYADLRLNLQKRLRPADPEQMIIQYLDDQQDLIMLSCKEDLEECLHMTRSKAFMDGSGEGEVVRLSISIG